jgi:hypothetical protein
MLFDGDAENQPLDQRIFFTPSTIGSSIHLGYE